MGMLQYHEAKRVYRVLDPPEARGFSPMTQSPTLKVMRPCLILPLSHRHTLLHLGVLRPRCSPLKSSPPPLQPAPFQHLTPGHNNLSPTLYGVRRPRFPLGPIRRLHKPLLGKSFPGCTVRMSIAFGRLRWYFLRYLTGHCLHHRRRLPCFRESRQVPSHSPAALPPQRSRHPNNLADSHFRWLNPPVLHTRLLRAVEQPRFRRG